jgi:hypothetical protein
MANTVALVSIATTGAVAILTPAIAAKMEARRARRDLMAGRFDELRAVLDEAALALDRVSLEIGGTSSIVDVEPTPEQELEQLKKLEHALRRVQEQKRRVALRLGEPSPLYSTLDAANDVGWTAWEALNEVIFYDLEFDASRRRVVAESVERLDALVSEFTALASNRIGPTATY